MFRRQTRILPGSAVESNICLWYGPMATSDKSRAKQIIVEIIRLSGGRLESKTRLYKTFYFAHLYYAKQNPGYLSDWPIVRMPHGPGIDAAEALIKELVADRVIEVCRADFGPFSPVQFRLVNSAIPGELSLEAIAAIRDAVEFAKSKSAAELSDLTHEYSRSWKIGRDGEELNIYIDLVSDEEFEREASEFDALSKSLQAVWN